MARDRLCKHKLSSLHNFAAFCYNGPTLMPICLGLAGRFCLQIWKGLRRACNQTWRHCSGVTSATTWFFSVWMDAYYLLTIFCTFCICVQAAIKGVTWLLQKFPQLADQFWCNYKAPTAWWSLSPCKYKLSLWYIGNMLPQQVPPLSKLC